MYCSLPQAVGLLRIETMRILYTIPRYGQQFTSNETHGEIVRELGKLDLSVDVLSFTTRTSASGPGGWGPGFSNERVYRHIQGRALAERALAPLARGLLHYEFFFSMLAGYLALVKPGAYDLIHVEGAFPLGAAAALASRRARTPYVVTTTGGDLFRLPNQDYGYARYRLPRQLIRLGLRRAAWVRANSTLSARLVAGHGADPNRISVLPVSIADISFPPPDQSLSDYRAGCRARLAAEYGWNTSPLIVCVGRLMSLKAPELLIEALPQIRELFGPVRVCIVGPSREDPERGDYLAFLRRRAAELDVTQFCTLTGYIPLAQIREFVAAADLLAVPSRLEGLNRVVIEAGAVGTPAIVSDGAGAAELVACYNSGLVVPAGSVTALARAISTLLARPTALRQQGQHALTLARDHSAAAVARGLTQIYAQAMQRSILRNL